MPVVRLRSGQHRDTAARLLERQQASTGYAVTAAAPSTSSRTATTAKPKATTTRSVSGAQVIRAAGGSAHDVAIWRSLSQARRSEIRTNIEAKGGSVLTRVRTIQRRRKARR